jgi:hypothetical protein
MKQHIGTAEHLTEDEMDDAILGVISPVRRLHLAGCADCRAGFEQFDSTVALFNDASTAWSEAKSNALNRDLKQHRMPIRFTARAVWTCASLLALLTATTVGIELRLHPSHSITAQTERPRIYPQRNAALDANAQNEGSNDDAMLLEIDAAINTSEPSPEQLYGDKNSPAIPGRNSRRTQVRD